jgi:hypothetical protein
LKKVILLIILGLRFKNKSLKPCAQNITASRSWWLTLVILATQEAEIRRTEVWSQPQANSS